MQFRMAKWSRVIQWSHDNSKLSTTRVSGKVRFINSSYSSPLDLWLLLLQLWFNGLLHSFHHNVRLLYCFVSEELGVRPETAINWNGYAICIVQHKEICKIFTTRNCNKSTLPQLKCVFCMISISMELVQQHLNHDSALLFTHVFAKSRWPPYWQRNATQLFLWHGGDWFEFMFHAKHTRSF